MYDMKNLAALKTMDKAAEAGMQAFWAFDKAAFSPGAVDGKTKQLMALAVALTTQCPYCIAIHTKEARKVGASDAELSETAVVAAAMRAGAAITHATHMFQE
jgi:AhpD family alkylhydroperoxidase